MRKIIINFFAVILCMALFPLSTFATSFSDTESHWASKEIEKWKSTGIIEGYIGKFRPDDPITRGEMVVIIDRLMNYYTLDMPSYDNPFTDLKSEFYYYPIIKAYNTGIIRGDGERVRPEDHITREEAVTMLGRAFGLLESNIQAGFADEPSISPWAEGFVNTFSAKGYVSGYENRFFPKGKITRAEVVKILDNSIAFIGDRYQVIGYFQDIGEVINGIVIINTTGISLEDVTINGDVVVTSGAAGFGGCKFTNVILNGNMSLQVRDRIEIDGGSYIQRITYEKYSIQEDSLYGRDASSVHVHDDASIIEKIYSKVQHPRINYANSFEIKAPIEFALDVWN
jgi:hypothetical protein